MEIIARVRTDFPTKFGVPRQSGRAMAVKGRVVFEPTYRNPDAIRGLSEFSHIWLIWGFSEVKREYWAATVRPPRLGGNERVGVFATRSPFRPNPIGLSCVRLDEVEQTSALGPILLVSGIDMMDGTPVYDIKPYLPFADSHPEASAGFAAPAEEYSLSVHFPEELLSKVPAAHREALICALSQDPRPSYQDDPDRLYGMPFADLDIRFTVEDGVLRVRKIVEGYEGGKPEK